MSFVHLHCHSAYTLGEGAARIKELVSAARALKMPELALTDRNNMFGMVSFYQQAQKAGVKPVVGMEVDLDDGSRLLLLARNNDGYGNLCHLATMMGLSAYPGSFAPFGFEEDGEIDLWDPAMRSALVFGWNREPRPLPRPGKPARLPREVLLSGRHTRGLVALSGGKHGKINSLVAQGKLEQASRAAGMLLSAFGEGNFFVEIVAHDERDRLLMPLLVGLAGDLDIPVVAANDVLYIEQKDAPVSEALVKARSGPRSSRKPVTRELEIPDGEGGPASAERYFKSHEEMAEIFAEYPQAIANTHYIAEQCDVELPLGKPHFPSVGLKHGETAFSRLWKLCFAGATRRYRPLTNEVISRLKSEVEVIETLGFSAYFLVVYDIVHFAHSRDIPILARGSAANSLVAYVLGITQVDPIANDLLFERFLNLSRAKFEMPDIDLDLCWRRRDEVLHYVYERYGRDHVATVGTHITFRLRSAWREMAKALGIEPGRAAYVANRLPHFISAEEIMQDEAEIPGLEDILDPGDGRFSISDTSDAPSGSQSNTRQPKLKDDTERRAFDLCKAVEGLPRFAGMHCGGIVVTPRPIADMVPLQRAARDPDMAITQYDKDDIESMGLVKIDLLGSRALTTLVDTIQASFQGTDDGRKMKDESLSSFVGLAQALEAIPYDDEATYRMMAEGNTLGCFQLESPGMRGLLKWLRPRSLKDVAIAISLFRPGPLEGGFLETFMRRRLNQEPVSYHHPAMEPILKETSGVILYQEQFLRLANSLAGMDLGEAEKLRKDLGKTHTPEERTQLGSWFVAGAIERGIGQLQAEKVWEIIAGYTGFGFCKAHACSYAATAYRSAYMKAHYPHHYLAAQINNQGGFYGPSVYVEDARRLGISILPPSVNESGTWCEVPSGTRSIRIGLQFVKGLSEKTIVSLIAERRANGPYRSLIDLMERVEMGPNEIEALVKVGAVDTEVLGDGCWAMGNESDPNTQHPTPIDGAAHLHLNRKQMVWLLPALLTARRSTMGRFTRSQGWDARVNLAAGSERAAALQMAAGDFLHATLSGDGASGGRSAPRILGSRVMGINVPTMDDYTHAEKLRLEQEMLGFTVTCNEIELYRHTLSTMGAVSSGELPRYAGREAKVGGVIVAGRRHITKGGEWMLFMTLQTVDGLVESVLFPEAYKEHARTLANYGYGPYIIKGHVQVSGKGRGIGVQPPSDLRPVDTITLKTHPVVIVEHVEPLGSSEVEVRG